MELVVVSLVFLVSLTDCSGLWRCQFVKVSVVLSVSVYISLVGVSVVAVIVNVGRQFVRLWNRLS